MVAAKLAALTTPSLDLVRGEEGTVRVYDPVLGRFTVFEPSGAYVADVRTPFVHPRRSLGTVLSRVVWRGWIPDSLMTRYDVNIASGEVVHEEGSPRGPWDVACAGRSPMASRTGGRDGSSWPAKVI